jgi:hypothetical protein
MRKRQRHSPEIPSEPPSITLPNSGPPDSFIDFLHRVTKGDLESGKEIKFAPVVKAIGRGRALDGWRVIRKWRGRKPEEVWPTLPDKAREVFKAGL